MTLNGVHPMKYRSNVKYLSFMFTSDSKDDVAMQYAEGIKHFLHTHNPVSIF